MGRDSMGRRFLALPILLCLIGAAPHRPAVPAMDGAGNRMAAFAAVTPPRAGEPPDPFVRHCTADRRWCARLRLEEGASAWLIELTPRGGAQRDFELAGVSDAQADYSIWPHIVIEAGGAIVVGVERTSSTSYSGGGASATRLLLVRAEPGSGPLRLVLDVPLRGGKEIRACFGPRDTRNRRGACSDQYEFAATLAIDPATRAGRPHFLLATTARTYPGRRTSDSDSTDGAAAAAGGPALGDGSRPAATGGASRSTRARGDICRTGRCPPAPIISISERHRRNDPQVFRFKPLKALANREGFRNVPVMTRR